MPIAVTTSRDRLEASVEIPAGVALDVDGVRSLFEREGLRHGLLREAVVNLTTVSDVSRTFVIARGTPPIHGEDGAIDCLVEPKNRPQAGIGEAVDLHELMAFVEVRMGEALARLRLPTLGTPGIDVRGEPIAPRPGRPADGERLYGEGTRKRMGDPLTIEAGLRGVMRRAKDRRWAVVVPLIIEGDVSFACGNINTGIAVVIKGDVKAGFTVKSADSILVHGAIEDARVSAQGDLEVRGGILPGEQRVKAHGDVRARFIADREVKGRDIIVLSSIRHATVRATRDVSAKEILGGLTVAGGSVSCTTLGSDAGARTLIEVGVDPFVEGMLVDLDRRRQNARDKAAALGERAKLLGHVIEKSPREDDAAVIAVVDLRAMLAERARLIREAADLELGHALLLQRRNEAAAAPERSIIAISGSAYPGVEVAFSDRARLGLIEPLMRPQFRLQGAAVVY